MLKEISWYIETNRFTNLVQEIESKAGEYREALEKKSGKVEERREELRTLCQWHMEKSGYKNSEDSVIDIDKEFFTDGNLNREALNTFEKEIIKAHLYQKHLWEFMGTTGCMTVISKTAMKNDSIDYKDYLPVEYKKSYRAKSPISNILKENSNAVPMYIYSDGTVSSEYNPEKSKIQFDTLKDKSGFDWKRKGWDPNYEIEKNDWHGAFNESDHWVMLKDQKSKLEKLPGAELYSIPLIEIVKDSDDAILYDAKYSLLSVFERIYLLEDGSIYATEEDDKKETVRLIVQAMEKMQIKQITAIVESEKNKDYKTVAKESSVSKNTEKKISLYKKLFKEKLSSEVRFETYETFKKIKEQALEKSKSENLIQKGQALALKFSTISKLNIKGKDAVNAIETNLIKVPLSVFNKEDYAKTKIKKEDYEIFQNYSVPDNKKALFSAVILDILAEENLILTSGKTKQELFDAVYEDVIKNKKTNTMLNIETTFSTLCKNPDIILTDKKVEKETYEQLLEAKKNLPEQETEIIQEKVDAAVDNIIRNFADVRMSTGIKPEEAVNLAAKIVRGKTGEFFTTPRNVIEYKRNESKPSEATVIDKRIFADIPLSNFIEKAKKAIPKTKEVNLEAIKKVHTKIKALKAKKYRTELNLFDETERKKWLESSEFKNLDITTEEIESIIETEKKEASSKFFYSEQTATFSKQRELDIKYGFKKENDESKKIVALIKRATKIKNPETLTEKQEKIYKISEIKADGKIERKILGAVSAEHFEQERKLLLNKNIFIPNEKIISNVRSNKTNQHIQANKDSPSMNTQDVVRHKISEQTDETKKIKRINENYEYDKAILKKSDPLFAKNQFWDIEHAEKEEDSIDDERFFNKKCNKVAKEIFDSLIEKAGVEF